VDFVSCNASSWSTAECDCTRPVTQRAGPGTLVGRRATAVAVWPVLGIVSAVFFLLAAAALLHWRVPAAWFKWLIIAGVACSIVLQVIWFSPWALFPLLVDAALLWAIFGMHLTVGHLRR
jgi:hypothetical protein